MATARDDGVAAERTGRTMGCGSEQGPSFANAMLSDDEQHLLCNRLLMGEPSRLDHIHLLCSRTVGVIVFRLRPQGRYRPSVAPCAAHLALNGTRSRQYNQSAEIHAHGRLPSRALHCHLHNERFVSRSSVYGGSFCCHVVSIVSA